jgi:hypothetical protein
MILRKLRTSAMELADHCQMMAGLIGIGTGIWLTEKGLLKSGGNVADGIVNAIIGALVSFPVTVPLSIFSFLLNRIFWTFPLREEAEKEHKLQREAEKARLAVNK